MSDADLRATVQRQAETIDALNASVGKLRARISSLEQQCTMKQSEIDSMRVLPNENKMIREENILLRDQLREMKYSASRIIEQSSIGNESQAALGIKVQAYQRHNAFLQGELSDRESKLRIGQERIDVLTEELNNKDTRISLLAEKLRQHHIDPSSANGLVLPDETLTVMKNKVHTQSATIDLLHEKVEICHEEAHRRAAVLDAVQKENKALRTSVSRLIAQISGMVADPADSARFSNSEGLRTVSMSP